MMRCVEPAAVPQDVVLQTKPELAWAMLEHDLGVGMPGRWVTADTVHGQDLVLRQRLEVCGRGQASGAGSNMLSRFLGRPGSPLWNRIKKLGLVDQGTGSTFAALADRGFVEVQWHTPTCTARARQR